MKVGLLNSALGVNVVVAPSRLSGIDRSFREHSYGPSSWGRIGTLHNNVLINYPLREGLLEITRFSQHCLEKRRSCFNVGHRAIVQVAARRSDCVSSPCWRRPQTLPSLRCPLTRHCNSLSLLAGLLVMPKARTPCYGQLHASE